jgi:hypothetical protein
MDVDFRHLVWEKMDFLFRRKAGHEVEELQQDLA